MKVVSREHYTRCPRAPWT